MIAKNKKHLTFTLHFRILTLLLSGEQPDNKVIRNFVMLTEFLQRGYKRFHEKYFSLEKIFFIRYVIYHTMLYFQYSLPLITGAVAQLRGFFKVKNHRSGL